MDDINLEDFREWLRSNTNLLEGSITLYVRTINHYLKEYGSVNQDDLNKFIADSFRKSQSFYVKYAFKHYLIFIKKPGLYAKLVPVRVKPRKKLGVYLPEHLIKKIILSIKKEPFMDIALIQYATGSRAREIITLKEQNIDLDFEDEVIRLRLEGKGGRERVTFLSEQFREVLAKYIKNKPGHLFLPEQAANADDEELERIIATQRTYFYNALKKAAHSVGIKNFGTHDFRRNVAEVLRKKTGDIRLVQKALGHVSIMTTARYFDDNPSDVGAAIIKHQTDDL